MAYSITCSTKILNLAIVPFLNFSSHSLWICYGARCVHFIVPQGRWGTRLSYHLAVYSSKRFKPLFAIILLCQGYCWTGKSTSKEFNSVMVLIIRSSSTLNFQFIFGFNKCIWAIFSLKGFENFWFYIWVEVSTQMILLHFLQCPWIKTWVQRPPYIFQNVEKDL